MALKAPGRRACALGYGSALTALSAPQDGDRRVAFTTSLATSSCLPSPATRAPRPVARPLRLRPSRRGGRARRSAGRRADAAVVAAAAAAAAVVARRDESQARPEAPRWDLASFFGPRWPTHEESKPAGASNGVAATALGATAAAEGAAAADPPAHASEGLAAKSVRIVNSTTVELTVHILDMKAIVPALQSVELVVPPREQRDVVVEGGPGIRMALRRGNEARLFVLDEGYVLSFASASTGHNGSAGLVEDIACSLMRPLPPKSGASAASRKPRPWPRGGASWEILPGPLFFRLSKNTSDVDFEVGKVLRAKTGNVSFKVVRDMGRDWRGYARARVRVLSGGMVGGKMFTHGMMYIAKIYPTELAQTETIEAHKRISGWFGPPAQIIKFEASVETVSGARLLLWEDFGQSMASYLESEGPLGGEDADRCAADLLAAIAAMHAKGMHHLALSENTVSLQMDGRGHVRLKLANLGVAEQPSQPLPPGYEAPLRSTAPEVMAPHRLAAVVRAAASGTSGTATATSSRSAASDSAGPRSKCLQRLGAIVETLPSVPQNRREAPEGAAASWWWPWSSSPGAAGAERRDDVGPASCAVTVREVLEEFDMFRELGEEQLQALCADFEGPYRAPASCDLFVKGSVGDYLYFILEGEVASRRGSRELCRYRRGDFLGEASLLGRRASQRFFSAGTLRGGGCILLRMSHDALQHNLARNAAITRLVAPSRWQYLSDSKTPLAEPKAADVFGVGALWCQLVARRPAALDRVRRAETPEQLRAAVTARDLGSFYFTVEECRAEALVTLLIRRASPQEALACLEGGEVLGSAAAEERRQAATPGAEAASQAEEPSKSADGMFAGMMKMVEANYKFAGDGFKEVTMNVTEGNSATVVASDIVELSGLARGGLQEWERMSNVATNRYGIMVGKCLGEIYGGLFAKDLLWMFRSPQRTPRFPVLLVRDAENGSLMARYIIGASVVFERELCERTLPRVVPSLKPAFVGGFEIGAAVNRNRAINFKILCVDAFLGSLWKELIAQFRIKFQEARGEQVRWESLGANLQLAAARGQAARRRVLLKFGRLTTTYDPNAPRVLELLPTSWVPDIGLPFASGIGRGFFKQVWKGFKRGRKKRYVRPKFETWDIDEVPQLILDIAREQGREQAGLVAGGVGDTLARDAGWWVGSGFGACSGFFAAAFGWKKAHRKAVAGGNLMDDQEVLAMAEYFEEKED